MDVTETTKAITGSIDRRAFVKGVALGGIAALAPGLASCAPEEDEGIAAPTGDWDGEYDLIVVGSGTAIVGAVAAAGQGARVLVVEKSAIVGGTTRLSGAVWWVPGNATMAEAGTPDVTNKEIVEYLQACDVYKTGHEDKVTTYVDTANTLFEWMCGDFGLTPCIDPIPDYYNLPGAAQPGRGLGFQTKEGELGAGEQFYTEWMIPLAEERGVEILTGTAVHELVVDEGGRVVGVECDSGRYHAQSGVLIGAGGFDHNEKMRKAFLRGQLVGSLAPETNTGDGIAMGMRVGAALDNMGGMFGCPFFIADDELFEKGGLGTTSDWGQYPSRRHVMSVNVRGRRFGNEAGAYGGTSTMYFNYDTRDYRLAGEPAFMVFDSTAVAQAGFPLGMTETDASKKPDWIQEYASLEELAADNGIEVDSFLSEVERFNGFAETGVDLDWGKGEGIFDRFTSALFADPNETTPNGSLGKIETPPFYVARYGAGSIGTNGGLSTNSDSQVLNHDGGIIEGLYACGCSAACTLGNVYPGPGGAVGNGMYMALRAVNTMFGMGIVKG